MMKLILALFCLLGALNFYLPRCIEAASMFHLPGDYLIGGLFGIHYTESYIYHDKPVALNCSSHSFVLSNYRKFQLMRFAVEEINNSTNLLPNVSLGYEIFDHCSDALSFPGVFKFISVNGLIHPWADPYKNPSKVIAVVGPFTSTQALTVAPLFMVDLFPMVNYGPSSSEFSEKSTFPSFLRTVHSNDDVVEAIVTIVQHFNWNWIAFMYSENDYGNDGLDLFIKQIKETKICLAYTVGLGADTNYSQVFKHLEREKINVVIVFAPELDAEKLIGSAIQLNITKKVWIAGESWSISKKLLKIREIENIGTVLGVSQPIVYIPGFGDFVRSSKSQTQCKDNREMGFCGQVCNCNMWSPEEILDANPTYSFPVYSAVYAIAHALHNNLECGVDGCKNHTVYPHKVLEEVQSSNFTLLNRTIQFDDNGDILSGFYTILFWNRGHTENIGFFNFHPISNFSINNSKILWHTGGKVPTSSCSPECPKGYARQQKGLHVCCFTCEICPSGTYLNLTDDSFKCFNCKQDTEWSAAGSTSCSPRQIEYIPYKDTGAVVIMVLTGVMMGLSLAVSALFGINYNTPVVRSAGGPMCFLILICLTLCSLSVFFYFGEPTSVSCIMRYIPFILFYSVCVACFVVRSFQIVRVFKIAAKIPKLNTLWVKYHGHWLLVTVVFFIQAFLLIGVLHDPPRPYNETTWYPKQIVLFCSWNLGVGNCAVVFLFLLCCLCFIFSYMGKDLPKNYNEAKAITFCLLLLIFTWIIFVTVFMLYHGKHIQTLNALAVLSSLYSFLLWYFLPKCYIIIFQPHKNTQQYFQGLIQSYTKTLSQ